MLDRTVLPAGYEKPLLDNDAAASSSSDAPRQAQLAQKPPSVSGSVQAGTQQQPSSTSVDSAFLKKKKGFTCAQFTYLWVCLMFWLIVIFLAGPQRERHSNISLDKCQLVFALIALMMIFLYPTTADNEVVPRGRRQSRR